MQGPTSGMFQAGRVLLLVGAILAAVASPLMVGMGFMMMSLQNFAQAQQAGPSTVSFSALGVVYIVIGVILIAGCIVGFMAYGRAKAGDARGAFVRGLVASLLPPVQILLLLGAIFCKVSPESQQPMAAGFKPA